MIMTPTPDAPDTATRRDGDELLLARVRVAVADRYDGLREIGRGGMAVVYAARDRKLNREVALKVLPPELAYRVDVRKRFVREAQTAARLNHPSIVPIYAVDEADGLVYFVMALVQGESLAARLQRERKPPLAFVRHVLAQVADALGYAHRAGVVHRDIKPDNILLEHATGRAIVTDFGIARAVSSGARLTQTGIAVGTPAFMSPEQAMGQRDLDGRSDVYALGLVGYLMLTARLPFEADTSAGLLLQHVHGTPLPLLNFRPDLPFALADAITRAISREPRDRWPDAAAFAAALRAGSEDDSRSAQPSAAEIRTATSPSVSDALERMNASLAHAGEQLRRAGQPIALVANAAAAAPLAPAAPAAAGSLPLAAAGSLPLAAAMPDQRAGHVMPVLEGWRRRLRAVGWSAAVAAGGLFMLAASGGEEPFLIPFFGGGFLMVVNGVRLLRHTLRLHDVGLGVRDALGERWRDKIAAPEGRPPDSPVPARARARGPAGESVPQRMQRAQQLVAGWKRRLRWTAGGAAVAAASLALGVSTGEEAFLVPMVTGIAATILGGALLVRATFRLRRLGIGVRDAFGDGWQARVAAMDDRSRPERAAEELARLADEEVLRSSAGRALREAVDDRLTIAETWARLDPADRELVPDVAPTADALLERIATLATSVARLDGAVEAHALPSLDERIVAAEQGTPSPERDRRLDLLRRQRSSLAELVDRQGMLQARLERASLALRTLRLDVVKLRAMGVGSALADVTSATQEASAISADIGRALDIAEEVRRI
jgi:serine/threonine-protein kinase